MLAVIARPLTAPSEGLDENLRGALCGDSACARRLCVELAPIILRTLRRVLGSSHSDLEDILQDTLIALLDGLASFKGESSIRHYARRVATYRALEHIRNARTRAQKLGELREEALTPSRSAYDELTSRRREALLHELLGSLSSEIAETLTLQAVLGHSVAETAEILGIPINTVRGRLQSAKRSLREKIQSSSDLSELLELSEHET